MPNEEEKQAIREAFLSGTLKVQTVDPSTGEVNCHPVKAVLRHNTLNKGMVSLKTGSGRSVLCTVDHSVFVVEGGLPVSIEAGTLAVGDEIAVVEDGKLKADKIIECEALPSRVHTYDLSVPGPENFVLTNGILAHNSYSVGGISLDIEKSSKYESLKNNAEGRFDKFMENKTRTVKIMRGLQQSRYGIGIRGKLGPSTGSGVITPAKFIGV